MTKATDFKRVKISNSICIGGMIAFGKSTLTESLKNKYDKNANVVFELDEDDNLMMMLLEKMYQRENNDLYGSLFQLYFVLNRFENYKKNANLDRLTIFDRSIFEDWLFARENINSPSVFHYYNSLWESVCRELIYDYGVPKLYIILDGDWELFKKRIYQRNRKVEIDNFEKNENYFKQLLLKYADYLVSACKDFGIDYIVVDANLEQEDKIALIDQKLQEIEKRQNQ